MTPSFGYLLDKSKKPECSKVNTEKCKKDKNDDDPCGLKRKGKTKKCPTDLLKNKRRKPIKPKKKTQGVITPLSVPLITEQYIPSNFNGDAPSTSGQRNF